MNKITQSSWQALKNHRLFLSANHRGALAHTYFVSQLLRLSLNLLADSLDLLPILRLHRVVAVCLEALPQAFQVGAASLEVRQQAPVLEGAFLVVRQRVLLKEEEEACLEAL